MVTFSALSSAGEKGPAGAARARFPQDMRQAWWRPNVITFNARTSGQQWRRALAFWQDKRQAWLQPNVATFNALISACEKGPAAAACARLPA